MTREAKARDVLVKPEGLPALLDSLREKENA
jgi:hypothetical protein